MARLFTKAELHLKARRRADLEGGTRRITPAEMDDYLSAALTELHEHLVHSGWHWSEKTQTIYTTGVAAYALPADFYATLGVDWKADAQRWLSIGEISIQDRNTFSSTGSRGLAYRKVGGSLTFYPTPPTGQTYRHIYVPAAVDIADLGDNDTVDGVNGWEELLVIDAAIKCLRKEDSDTSALVAEREQLRVRITASAEDREILSTHRVQDVEDFGDDAGYPPDPGDYRR